MRNCERQVAMPKIILFVFKGDVGLPQANAQGLCGEGLPPPLYF